VQLAAEHGAEIDAATSQRTTPIQIASENGHSGIVKILVSFGAKLNRKRHNDSSPLIAAVRKSQYETVHLLLENRADVNTVGPRGDTPLLAAINTTTNDLMLHLLLDYNPVLAHVTPDRRTALSLAVALGNVSVVTVLEPLPGQDWSITDGRDQTLVHLAILAQSPAVL
jgi:ankyrin repeat protein